MARQRVPGGRNRPSSKDRAPSRPGINVNRPGSHGNMALCRSSTLWIVSSGILIMGIAYVSYQGYLQTRVNTPLSVPSAVSNSGLSDPTRFWGSYRPGVYFGMKTRSPYDLLSGLMWFIPDQITQNDIGFRHWCEQGDNLARYGWVKHDGENFGVQEIFDRNLKLTTSFVKRPGGDRGGDWTARIRVEQNHTKKVTQMVSLFFYFGLDEKAEGALLPVLDASDALRMNEISGTSPTLGSFRVKFVENGQAKQHFHAKLISPGPQSYTDLVMRQLRRYEDKQAAIGLDPTSNVEGDPNLLVYQVNAVTPFELDVVFESGANMAGRVEGELVGNLYTDALKQLERDYDLAFEAQFHLQNKGFSRQDVDFAQAALSNMVGGIGYFYGHSLVQSDSNPQAVQYWDAPLYSAVPSRSFFPRGFLWDEGFHNLLIAKWNPKISADILAHWLDLINVEGWIPREQILGLEARAKVPAEFVVQHNKNANPPTLLLALESMMHAKENRQSTWFREFLVRVWPRLELWYDWFNTSQQGPVPGSFRWRGRNGTADRELNPKTLTSGLDDYPRASHPTEDERHLDLRCWMALASKLMADIGRLIGMDHEKYSATSEFLHDNMFLNEMHWSEKHKAYLDFGFHTEDIRLERPPINSKTHRPGMPKPEKIRVTKTPPKLQYVPQLGYNSLFPFILQIIDPSSPKLAAVLADLEDPQKLFTPYGLRSLSQSASLYMKRNTEHDPPYWRGPIWININFLAVRALKHYADAPGPNQYRAQKVYLKLRQAVIGNVIREYHRTGYIWEQYHDKTGHGQGCRPFTGWSALTVLMMGETY
ncbi:hypothetical protein TCAL_06619 [Tigriopus californicus]|uniref:Mannosyl-oligosaccharide glucosidase n=1 Tax=Tigriopus californicus TaxID=6832 RepID=A0A553PLR1_TIGCA|nr:mannosyl-oligosaccharide glucosidase-like [Tigriopus californicus]TRY78619.1 hypothetical protein TCAL_06619 [Tigriopus californicus]